ncbi:uncharacterized protein LOC119678992 [Teleopsis dalmanni]|uniref:uncharacterized protein LOC119678992 n=1 Tax=Teleopsis dalmanni TaxID=139649 RepID=UPI0018CD7955|nr:uncharacterized protein LOC119678992 [Teleopsis dalmanni]
MTSPTESFHEDELVPPEWVNIDFFEAVLQSCENVTKVEVCKFKLTPGTVKGDHFASVIFRANVDYKIQGLQKKRSLIIKIMPEMEGAKKDMLMETHIFETEVTLYTKVLPKFESILRSIGDSTKIGPNCLYFSLHPKKCIVFEDLVPLGYTVQRDREINMEEIREIMRKLAVFHAIGYSLNIKEPELFDNLKYGLMNQSAICDSELMTDGIAIFIEMLNEIPSLRMYKPYFEAIQKNLFKKCRQTYDEFRENRQNDSIYVLCHGDFNYKNLMFKHNPIDMKLEDILILDFQLCHVGTTATDLYNTFYMACSREQRMHHFEELFHLYYNHFKATLEKIDFHSTIPKFAEVKAMFLKHKYLGFFLLSSFLPMCYGLLSKTLDAEKLMSSREYRKTLYNDKGYIEELQHLLPKLLHRGYFEDLV